MARKRTGKPARKSAPPDTRPKTEPAAKPQPLTRVQLTYIRAQMDKVSVEEIAADLGLPVLRVQRQVDKYRQEDAAAPPPPPPEGAGDAAARTPLKRLVAHPSGAAVMTGDQSLADDAALGASPFESVPVTEAQRSYIVQKKDLLPAEQIARDCSLPPYVVRQVIDCLDRPREGREKFYSRHKDSLHKIRPDEPTR